MLLSELFEGSPDIEIKQLSIDSRLPMKDCIFFCLSGIRYDGHHFIDEAIKNGASVIVYEDEVDTSKNAVFIKVSDVADCLNDIAAKFYDYPARGLESFIVCGCDGQSSVSNLIYSLISKVRPCASVGSCGIHYGEHHLYSSVPTLTILDNHKYLYEFVRCSMESCVFEGDAMSLSYKKLDGIDPDVFVYTSTNEYATEFEEIGINYYDALVSYLYTLDEKTLIILNKDDIAYDEMVLAAGDNYLTYGCKEDSDFVIEDIKLKKDGSSFSLKHKGGSCTFNTKLLGMNNIYNAAAAIVALVSRGYDTNEIAENLAKVRTLDGVMDPVDLGQDYSIYIDCADNIKSLHDVYDFGEHIRKAGSKVYAVWGINGTDESDTLKEIAELSESFIDHMILTENNSYSGNMMHVMKKALPYFESMKPLVIEDRSIAIESAVEMLNRDDILFILGKGNETTITRNLGKETYIGDKKAAELAVSRRLKEEKDDI